MKTPRDLSGAQLARALRVLGYVVTRQSGSHIRVTTQTGGEHHEVVPNHSPVKIGALKSNLRNVAVHHKLSVQKLIELLEL